MATITYYLGNGFIVCQNSTAQGAVTTTGGNISGTSLVSSVSGYWAWNSPGTVSTNTWASQVITFAYGNYRMTYALPTSGYGQWQAGSALPLSCTQDMSISASSLFSSSNPTVRTVTITGTYSISAGVQDHGYSTSWYGGTSGNITLGTVTLNAPPTFKVTNSGGTETTQMYFDTNYVYAGLTTASIKVANLSAKYGGNIASAVLKIGNQTATRTTNGELSILLNTGGTFTPTVTVTDSRGQTTTKTLDAITVNVYSKPSVTFDVERTAQTGVLEDEGTYAIISPTFTFTDVIATLTEPTVTVTDNDGITTTVTPNWYSSRAQDGTLSGTVTWANISSGDTVYGLISGFNTQYSYQISVTPEDSEDTGTTQTQTLGGAFYTVDFLAGGHGIAFGTPATDEVFECAMDATFDEDVFISLPEYTTSGSVDKEIYDNIVALGWDSDVLIS